MNWLNRCRTSRRTRRGGLTLEWILIVTIVVIGVIGGLGTLRNSLFTKINELDEAVNALNVKPEAEMEAEP